MRNLIWVVLVLFAAACGDCGGGGPTDAKGKIEAQKKSREFAASCPKPSDPKYVVDFETLPVILTNTGKATSYLNKFEVETAFKEVFVVDQAKVPETIAQGETVEIPVTFMPNASGTIIGKLHVAGDLEDGSDTFDITLSGEGKSFAPLPTFSASCSSPNTTSPTLDGCNPSSASVPRSIRFLPTGAGGYIEVPVTLKNAGCPKLTVSNIKVATTSSDDSKDGFALAEGQATSLDVAGGNGTAVINVRFAPQTAGTIYKGTLTFETNDPDAADAAVTIKLDGEGTSASLWLDKTACDFSKLVSPCNGQFEIRNSGQLPLTLSKVSLKKGNPLFKLENADAFTGQSVTTGSFATLVKVTYDPAGNPNCPATVSECNDTLVVESDAGTAEATLQGGSPAVLKTLPATAVDFNAAVGGDPLDHNDHFETLELQNVSTYSGQLDLTIKDLAVSDSRNAFSVVSASPLPAGCDTSAKPFAKDTVVKPGESFTACLKFTSDILGGSFSTNMNVLSSDPSYPELTGLIVELKAQATCEAKPTATIEVRKQGASDTCPCSEGTGCPATSTCGVKLPSGGTTSGTVDISGEASFSPTFKFDGTGQCVEDVRVYTGLQYEWTLVSPIDGSASILPDGKSGAAVTTLTYSKAVPHVLKLKVTDSKGAVSNSTSFTVNASPP
ncbi:MAG TPA: hypothetical protein VGK67_06965 [Myxococcales bacterium]|jgi:hypothetical protein